MHCLFLENKKNILNQTVIFILVFYEMSAKDFALKKSLGQGSQIIKELLKYNN